MAKNQNQTRLYIDGENLLFTIADILKAERLVKHKADITSLNIAPLITTLRDYKLDNIAFYSAKIQMYDEYPELAAKSKILLDSQERLSNSLANQDIDYISAGAVRLQEVIRNRRGKFIKAVFKEKGTDVRLAVDMLDAACEGQLDTALLISSDADMHPIISELKKRSVSVVYVGVEHFMSKELMAAANQSVEISKPTVLEMWRTRNR